MSSHTAQAPKNKSIYHWVMLLSCIVTLMLTYAPRISLASLFAPRVIREMGFSSGSYFLYSTITSVICMFTAPIAGKLMRGKYMRPTFLICVIGTIGSYALNGFCHALWQFWLVGALVGIFAMGACTLPVSILITNWFEKDRGLMISIAMMGISIGGTVLSPILSALIESQGWRHTYMILGIASLVIMIPIAAFVVRRSPEDIGLLPYGHGEISNQSAKKKNGSASGLSMSLAEAKRTPIFWLLLGSAFLIYMTACIISHITLYITSVGFEAATAAKFVSLYSFVAIFGKLALGRVFDRFGTKGGILFGNGMWILFLLCFLLIKGNPVMLYASAVLYGFGTCVSTVSIPIITSSVFGTKHYSELFGFVSTFTMFGSAIGASVIGTAYDILGSYTPVLLLLLTLSVLMTLALLYCLGKSRKMAEKQNPEA